MVRHLIEREIKKRLAIRIRKQNEPGIPMRALAKEYRTSLRVVCDAMTRSIADWRDLLDEVMPRQVIKENITGTRSTRGLSPATPKPSKFYEPDMDPDLDGDPKPELIKD